MLICFWWSMLCSATVVLYTNHHLLYHVYPSVWSPHHPHYTPQETFVRRRGRKPQLDPRTLNLDRLTGEENVAVVERGSGKKVRRATSPHF